MTPNRSPWLAELNRIRETSPLAQSESADVVIVGGGIAGAVTAYFILKDTEHSVMILEADKVAHGATGHNAGQITSYFERPFESIVQEFGLDMAVAGQRDVELAWDLIQDIQTSAKLETPLHRFTGFAGCTMLDQFLVYLQENTRRIEGGLQPEALYIADDTPWKKDIPEKYSTMYAVVTKEEIQAMLDTRNDDYCAVVASPKGCMNSARFTEEVIGYLHATYPKRFVLHEETVVEEVTLYEDSAHIQAGTHVVQAKRVVLATNGFEQFHITNTVGVDIDSTFHHLVTGRIGYMAAYIEDTPEPPTAISYLPKRDTPSGDPTGEAYFYLTRRPHQTHATEKALVCVGGPDQPLPNLAIYSRADTCRDDIKDDIDEFLKETYAPYPTDHKGYEFCWHGLMGYTPGGLRRIGVEPCNTVLLYNLGCNGVGILPSVYGGKRIADILSGKEVSPSIFDPLDQRKRT